MGIKPSRHSNSSNAFRNDHDHDHGDQMGKKTMGWSSFRMPLHYPRYKKSDYERMSEWELDLILGEYGLQVNGDVEEKRKFATGAFLWPQQIDS
ncbi:PREDICTED: uncharacterized protein LOC104824547 [Tarenaya hassleriana]|uniref:uncharacterized protein LOC104824547 n=1 Tax=Tarenaya hassleriana TaxID=28532 RepID=UPI00053C210F|nr:PREDICTED: uncharacterized protein LOC104824547 [Tarenaya hassleriana]